MATNGQRLPLALFIASAPPPVLWVEGELDLTTARSWPGSSGPGWRPAPGCGSTWAASRSRTSARCARSTRSRSACPPAAGSRWRISTEPVRRVLDLAGFRADAVVIEA